MSLRLEMSFTGSRICWSQLAAFSLWIALAVVTAGPVTLRPEVTADPQFDRLVILSMVGAVTAMATVRHKMAAAAALPVAVAALEASQLFTPGRHASLDDVIIKSMGALTGYGIVWLLQRTRAAGWVLPATITGTALLTGAAAGWYVVSPGLALEHLRQAIARNSNAQVAGLDDPIVRSAIVGTPGQPLVVDLWGRTASTFHLTVKSDDHTRALLVLGFERQGLCWQLTQVSPPHQRRFESNGKGNRGHQAPT